MDQLEYPSEAMLERLILVGVQPPHAAEWEVADSLEELQQLADTAGGQVIHRFIFKQRSPHPGLFIGKGKAQQIAAFAEDHGPLTVVFDEDLSPAQGRNLERITDSKVIDRTQVILDIFAQHAHTREGRLQVNLARLEYLLPRLRRMWTHLERQKGGIGLRGGPGEQQIEVDRRRIRQQIDRLQRELEGVRRHRAELRRSRHRHGWAAASLVGYTNAGKSTLLNRLTGADVVTNDQLFVTLDPTTRQIRLPNRQRVLLTDTVGFIRKLPHHLVESFKATLEEVILADILVHVVDASHPRVEQQIDAVQTVLKEMGVHDKSVLTVFNKIDCEGAEARAKKLARNVKPSVLLSARGGYGLEYFAESMADILRERNTGLCLRIPQARARMLSELRAEAMIREEAYAGQDVLMDVRLPEWMAGRYEPYAIQRDDYVKTLNATDGHQWEQQEKSEGKNLYHT